MATYNSQVTRTDSGALIPEEVAREIIQNVPQSSAVMRLARRLPNMTRAQLRMPVLAGFITASFVTGDTGLKQTSEVAWSNKYINAEELAVIVPIPEKVLDDVDYDIWSEIRPGIVEAFGKAIDAAILFGTNKPSDWPDGIVVGAAAAGSTVTVGAIGGDIADDIMGVDGVLSKVEMDGYAVNGHIAAMSMKARLRSLRDTTGQFIFLRTMQGPAPYELDGQPVEFPTNGAFDPLTALLVSGDWSQLVYSIRQDVTYKLLTEAVITDSNGAIIYNLPQQDMVALRCVMRLGWQLPNPINQMNPTEATRYPFAALLP